MATDINTLKKQITSSEEWLKKEFQQIRTGQASPQVLDGIRVEIFGAPMSLKEVASVTIEGARTLRISPWDKSHVKEIEKAITAADLGLSVSVDDQGLRVNFPQMTAEGRLVVAKLAKERLEEARKQVRHERDTFMKELNTKEKEGGMGKDEAFRIKNEAQKVVDEQNKKLDSLYEKKEKEIVG